LSENHDAPTCLMAASPLSPPSTPSTSSMSNMCRRERVLTAMRCEQPDRVPAVLWGSYYTLNDETYFNFLRHATLGDPLPPFRKKFPRNSNYYDERVLDYLDTDARYVDCGFTNLGGARMDGDCRDAWGVKWERMGPNNTSVGFPLANATLEQASEHSYPNPTAFFDFRLLEETIRHLQENYPTHAIGARAVNSYGPLEQASELRGREQFLMDTVAEPELAMLILEKCADVIVRGQEAYLDKIGKHVDFFEIPGDDYGANHGLLLSPTFFRTAIKPCLSRIVQSVKSYRSDLPVVFHTDGAIMEIIPDLIEIGIDVLNPLEPLPATDWAAIKQRYGKQLAFMGGIDLKTAMTGPVECVEAEVKRRIEIFGPGGGYIVAPANHLQKDVPPANIEALFAAARKHGRYPLS
jgi:uroporphyrinogen decarboxylase